VIQKKRREEMKETVCFYALCAGGRLTDGQRPKEGEPDRMGQGPHLLERRSHKLPLPSFFCFFAHGLQTHRETYTARHGNTLFEARADKTPSILTYSPYTQTHRHTDTELIHVSKVVMAIVQYKKLVQK
jgi:hypothetical protein